MPELETNIFPITNLNELSSRYRLADIAGLHPDQAEYYQNRQALERRLSYLLKKPVLVIERDGSPLLVVPEEVNVLPAEVPLVRVVIQLRLGTPTFELDYTRRSDEADLIALRFLRFLIQAPLHRDRRLWQPAAGRPFFPRRPDQVEQGVQRFVGFSLRPVITPVGGLGLCVDPVSCYVGEQPLPIRLTRDEFVRSWKDRNCIYRFGEYWYEIRLHGLADRSVSTHRFLVDGKPWSLMDYLLEHSSRPHPTDLAELDEDAAVVLYQNNRGAEMAAPAPLCYPIFDTSSEQVSGQHRRAILPPDERRRVTHRLVQKYLQRLEFGGTRLQLGEAPVTAEHRKIAVPDFQFGKGVVLSVRGTPGAECTDLQKLGDNRLTLLRDPTAGPYIAAPLDRQYLLLPRSVHDSFGSQFTRELIGEVDQLLPGGGYNPAVVCFDDRGPRTFPRQALAIREAMARAFRQPGYALVMVHRTQDRKPRDEDQLAAMVVQELRDRFDVRAAVIHSEVPRRAYREVRERDGSLSYHCCREQRGRLSGYLRNVAISKVLLTNQRWPFVLATPLHADVTVGVDVKKNTCGLLVVGNHGSMIRSELRTSRQKERLLTSQVATYLMELLQKEVDARGRPLSSVVVHRDGRAWTSEVEGIRQALRQLRASGYLTDDARYAVIEISKSSPVPLRLYYVRPNGGQRPSVGNPTIGCYYQIDDRDAYLCSTGYPFLRQGTAHPLHVRLVDGALPLEECLRDLYALTTLAWTQPDGCIRYPITIKLNDRILMVEAGEYDVDSLDFGQAREDDSADEEIA